MTPTELLTKRVRCIASGGAKEHYPGSPFEVGEVLTYDSYGAAVYVGNTSSATALTVDGNPHLFEQMAWWEERKVGDIPEFVRNIANGAVYKVLGVNIDTAGNISIKTELYEWMYDYVRYYTPATLDEYNAYITKQSI